VNGVHDLVGLLPQHAVGPFEQTEIDWRKELWRLLALGLGRWALGSGFCALGDKADLTSLRQGFGGPP
jgi:hypothetical protein